MKKNLPGLSQIDSILNFLENQRGGVDVSHSFADVYVLVYGCK